MNQKGQAFLQIIIALAIVSIMGGGAVMMIRSSQNELSVFAIKQGHLRLQQDIKMSLNRSLICQNILQASFNPTNAENPVSIAWPGPASESTPSVAVMAGADLVEYGIRVNSIGFVMNPAPIHLGRLTSGAEVYYVSLRLSSQSSLSGNPFGNVNIGPFYIEVRNNTVTNCYSNEDIEHVTLTTCEIMGGTFQDGLCGLPAKLADISCTTDGYSLQAFNLKYTTKFGCVDVR